MQYTLAELTEVMSATHGKPPPREVLIFPAGWFGVAPGDGREQQVLCDERAARRLIADFHALRRDVVIDYEHATVRPSERHDGTAPAAGWLKALRWQPGRGVVASVDWTARGAARVAAREYRYLSPVVEVDPTTSRVRRLRSVALTNDPAIQGATVIAASKGGKSQNATRPRAIDPADQWGGAMPVPPSLAQALGVSSDAPIEDCIAALTPQNVGRIAKFLGLSDGVAFDRVAEALERELLEHRDEIERGDGVAVTYPPSDGAGDFALGQKGSVGMDSVARAAGLGIGASVAEIIAQLTDRDRVEAVAKALELPRTSTRREVIEALVELVSGGRRAGGSGASGGGAGGGYASGAAGASVAARWKSDAELLAEVRALRSAVDALAARKGASFDPWDSDAGLRAEFGGNRASYLAFKAADEQGLVRIPGRSTEGHEVPVGQAPVRASGEPARRRKSPAPLTPDAWSNPAVRAEFRGDRGVFEAYCRACAAGLVV